MKRIFRFAVFRFRFRFPVLQLKASFQPDAGICEVSEIDSANRREWSCDSGLTEESGQEESSQQVSLYAFE